MAIGRTNTGGGYHLNFDVVNSTIQPTDPKENTIWLNNNWVQNGWSFSADMPLRRTKSSNKNFVVYPYYSNYRTVSGITFTNLTDGNTNKGKFLVNGTATSDVTFRASYDTAESGMFLLPAGKYTVSGCPAGGEAEKTYAIQVNYRTDEGEWLRLAYETGSGANFTLTKDRVCNICFRVWNGATLNNLEVYFQIEKGTSATEFKAGNANGQVWVKPKDAGAISFDALKNNGKIVLHPGEVYMYNESGGWNKQQSINVMIYQNGEWKYMEDPWDGYYYNAGDQCEAVTGGWTTESWTSTQYNQMPLAQINSDHLYVEAYGGCISQLGTSQKVNLSNIKTLKASVKIESTGTVALCISDTKSHQGSVAKKEFTATGTHEYSIDVSNHNGSYYIMLYAVSTNGSAPTAKITSVWGE